MKRARIILTVLLFIMITSVSAKQAVPMAENPVIEKRMLAMASELRCLVCQNESLAASRSEFAKDIRREMRSMIEQGKSDQQIIDFLVDRYGDFIRFRPPMNIKTFLLWFGPLLLLVIAASVFIYNVSRQNRRVADAPLTQNQRERIKNLLADEAKLDNDA